jgi:hypothetical protein
MRHIQALLGKSDVKRPMGRPRHRCGDNIKMHFQEVGCGGMDWADLVQDWDRWAGIFERGNKLWDSIKCGEFLD